jgi:lipopolysaccharide export system protein LptA
MRSRSYPRLPATAAAVALLWSSGALALATDKDQPIDLEADSVELDEGRGMSIYSGSVVLKQGTLQVRADKVTVLHTGSKPSKVEAEGRPVRFQQLPDKSTEPVKGEALKAVYEVNSEELVLLGNAVLSQGRDTFRSDRIVYDRVKSVVKAGAAAKGKERVRITVDPKGRKDKR